MKKSKLNGMTTARKMHMKKDNKPPRIVIFAAVIAALIVLTHCERVNDIPGVSVTGGGVTVDIGDFHYHN